MALAFSSDEFSRRLAKVQEKIVERGLSALILTRPQNIYYLSGFRASHFAGQLSELHTLVVPTSGLPRLMTRALEKGIAQLQWTKDPYLHMDHEDPYLVLQRTFDDMQISKGPIGIEERFVSVRQFYKIKNVLPGAEFIDTTGLVEAIAVQSTPAEIQCLKGAAEVTRAGFTAGIQTVADGVYPYEIVAKIHDTMYRSGQSDFDMSMVCVWAGEKGGFMHDTRTTEKIKKGDAVTIEIFGVDNQYKVGAQGTVFIGKPSAAIEKNYRILVDMFNAARDAVRPAATSGDIYDAANRPYRAAWGADYYRKVGGSLGLTVFNIALSKGNKDVLQPGMCLLLQVLVDDPVLMTCSSTVLVTDTGCETLTDPILDLHQV